MITRISIPGPTASDPKQNWKQYEADCLAGRQLPASGDTKMQDACRRAWRLREWFELFTRYHLAGLTDAKNRISRIRRNLGALEGERPDTVTRMSLMPWFEQLGARNKWLANAALNELKLVYAKMLDWGVHTGSNPTVGMKRFPHNKPRRRFIQLDELDPLLDSLSQAPLDFQLIFLLCLNVGCRPGEALKMQWKHLKLWQEVDGRTGQTIWRGRWTKPTTKTGLPHIVPIPEELVKRFQDLPRSSEWVFPGQLNHQRRLAPGPLSYAVVHKYWRTIARRVGLDDVTTYDLRRTCATYLVNRGTNIALVSKGVLNHTSLQNTGVYTQAMMEPVRDALQEHSEFILRKTRRNITIMPPAAVLAREELPSMEWPG